MALRLAVAALLIAELAGAASVPGRTQIVVGLRQSLLPEKDNSARLSQAGRKEAARRRVDQNEALEKRAEEIFQKSDVLKQMALFILPFLHGEPEARSLLLQVRGKDQGTPRADLAVLPRAEWDALQKDFADLDAFLYDKKDGHGGDLAVVYEPKRLKERIAVLDRVDRLTEMYVDDLLVKKLGLHPSESGEVANRLKAEVRSALSPKGGALKSGKNIEREFVRGLSDQFVKDYLGPELDTRWKGHDPSQAVTSAHQPGDRETASSSGVGGGHQSPVPPADASANNPAKPAEPKSAPALRRTN